MTLGTFTAEVEVLVFLPPVPRVGYTDIPILAFTVVFILVVVRNCCWKYSEVIVK